MASPRNAGIYCRLSYADDGTEERMERQEADCRQVGDRLSWPISEGHIFRDPARSAWQRNRKRPGWDAMLTAVESGQIDALIVYHGDRLIRQPYDLERLIGIADSKGVRIASVSGTRNLDSPDDRFILRIEAAQACRESDNTSRRVRRAARSRAEKGRPSGGGKRAFGFEADGVTQRAAEVEVLAGAVDRLLSGQSDGGVLRWMNSVSTTSQGNPWQSKSLRNILERPRIAGLIAHNGELYPAAWEPVISVETWADVQALMRRRALEHPYPGRERRYLLSGVAVCPTGHTLQPKPSGGRNRPEARLYWCKTQGCPTRVGRSVQLLDSYVEGRVLRRLNDPKFVGELTAPEPSVAPEIAALERRRDETRQQLEDLAEFPDLDPGLLARTLAGFDKKISSLRNQQTMSSRRRLLSRMAGIGAQEWSELPVDVRSDVVRALFRVVVLPATKRGPGFDENAVVLERLPLD